LLGDEKKGGTSAVVSHADVHPDAALDLSDNRLLQSLPDDLRASIFAHLEPVTLALRQTVCTRGEVLEYVYFPTNSMISVVVSFENGNTIEAELVGNDGYNGVSLLLGQPAPHSDMYVQIAGDALRMQVDHFKHHLKDARFRVALGAYTADAYTIVAQLAGCVAFHPVEQRLARWLLMVGDRIDRDELPLTHEFLGIMLGTYRPTVTLAIHMLQQAGLIEHHRGRTLIINRPGLEDAACECYEVIKGLHRH
jgi:CRP-like cAMP-binding protein